MWMGIVGVRVKISLASALPTVNGPERSVSRESVAVAKRKATACVNHAVLRLDAPTSDGFTKNCFTKSVSRDKTEPIQAV